MNVSIFQFPSVGISTDPPPFRKKLTFSRGGDLYEIQNRAAPAAGFSSSRVYTLSILRFRKVNSISIHSNLKEILIMLSTVLENDSHVMFH